MEARSLAELELESDLLADAGIPRRPSASDD
jgi:hypothetical protein